MKFYPDDWISDERLGACSLAAQGLWIRLLSLMHKNARRGYLQQANGQPYSQAQLARLTGSAPEEVAHLLRELENSGVSSATEDGVTYSRRMVYDENLREIRSKSGKKGGKRTGILLKQNRSKTPSKTQANTQANSDLCLLSGENQNGLLEPPEGGGGARGAGETFAEFWAAYPRKQKKPEAEKAWKKLKPDAALLASVLAAIERQKKSRQWLDGYVPHPGTWLNQRRWEDEEFDPQKGNHAPPKPNPHEYQGD